MNTVQSFDPMIRWMLRRDIDEVLAIDRQHVWPRWSEDHFMCELRERNVIGTVIESERGCVDGFTIYSMENGYFLLKKIAVRRELLRSGIGARLVQRLIGKLCQMKRTSVVAYVPERLVGAQLFFQSQGFKGWPEGDEIRFDYSIFEGGV